MAAAASKTGKAKLDDVTSLLDSLKVDLDDKTLSPQRRKSALEQLKVYGRSVDNADPIFTPSGIETLAKHAFDNGNTESSREALRCLANSLLLRERTRQMLVDLGYPPKAAERLKTNSSDDEFLVSRILFLLTYGTNANFKLLISEHQLADSILQCFTRHAARYSSGGKEPSSGSPMDDMALTETCKLMFNIIAFFPDLSGSFSKAAPSLLNILRRAKIPTPPLQQPVGSIINALINLDFTKKNNQGLGYNALFPKEESAAHAELLIKILGLAVSAYPEAELDPLVTPIIALMRKIYGEAPEPVRKTMESLLLPADVDRSKPLGRSATLSSRLLRLSTSALTPTLRDSISGMMFELSGQDPQKFVRNVGYGFAAGFLMSQGIPVPNGANEAYANDGGVEINPVTGQRRDTEPEDTGPPMTDEEKEREAERLFVLFERLKKTGIVDVKNPVEQAMDEGRFEELPDD